MTQLQLDFTDADARVSVSSLPQHTPTGDHDDAKATPPRKNGNAVIHILPPTPTTLILAWSSYMMARQESRWSASAAAAVMP